MSIFLYSLNLLLGINGDKAYRKSFSSQPWGNGLPRVPNSERLGITLVAVYSDADKNSLHTQQGDYSYNIGPAASNNNYLNKLKIIDTALKSGAQAIHPGYGFYQKILTLPIL